MLTKSREVRTKFSGKPMLIDAFAVIGLKKLNESEWNMADSCLSSYEPY